MTTHYARPGWVTRHLLNPAVAAATGMGVSVLGSRVLETRGRKSGQPRRTPVNLLNFEGQDYLVAPRGEAEWVRNARADGGRMTLVLGRRRTEVVGHELDDDEKVPVLRAYLARWKFEVGAFFEGVGPESSDAEIRAIAGRHPVFRLNPA